MSEKTIYIQLVKGGLSPAGACGLMGNMQAESALRANNVQDGYGYSDADYTAKVDAGLIDFIQAIGYGLCQWTDKLRKKKLLEYARSLGKSIGDEAMQVAFCLKELREDYPALFAYLCVCTGVYEAAERVCKEYERPAVNNVSARATYANGFFMALGGLDVEQATPEEDTWATTPAEPEKPAEGSTGPQTVSYWPPRELSIGMSGGDVAAVQALLAARGYGDTPGVFDVATQARVKLFQAQSGLKNDGIVGAKTWAALCER